MKRQTFEITLERSRDDDTHGQWIATIFYTESINKLKSRVVNKKWLFDKEYKDYDFVLDCLPGVIRYAIQPEGGPPLIPVHRLAMDIHSNWLFRYHVKKYRPMLFLGPNTTTKNQRKRKKLIARKRTPSNSRTRK